ncbi:MAG: hypothetical protein KKD66_27100, partial [Proteobacteria bacterium]|nr:hypothetical protein [Pseudomonadota bacterium]
GQLYLKEFYEEIDWESGDDPQYVTFIPVRDEANAVEVNTLNSLGLLSVRPSIRVDHPKGMPLTVKRLL